ncbi:hypothetical protein CFOL_v3_26113 [Cephalotus follicularis]|uniref:Uncharacterized protein n=1 Tax=Cephalotus follicularis TaxID=3775 RepID=A0A1Q3CR87_CEPFO|nr:hypothetical protein CFOL_v3_26113 [Cephalotus follicularis]
MAKPTLTTDSPIKRQKPTHHHHQPLIPGLPDDIAQLCLSHVHPSILYSVCHAWRRLIYSPCFPPFLSLYAIFTSSIDQNDCNSYSNPIQFLTLDSFSSRWDSIPPPPSLNLLLRHPAFISRNLPVQSVSIGGQLILVAATGHDFYPALPRPLVFNPLSQKAWTFGPPLATPRRWCAAGASRGALYVASGIGSHFSMDVATSVEKWDLMNKKKKWEKMKLLKNGKYCRDAVDAVGWRGKLCMVNVKGDAAKEGVVYDVERNTWEEMAEGMVAGWRGPVAAMDEQVMYVVAESKGALRRYDAERDCWEEIMESERLIGAQQIAAAGGRVCCVCGGDGGGLVVVDVVAKPPRLLLLDTPPGLEPVALHILPRMCHPDF